MRFVIVILVLLCISGSSAYATSNKDLAIVPTARFEDSGTFSAGVYKSDNLYRLYSGYQWGDYASISLYKQKDRDLNGDKYDSSINTKLLLFKESEHFPQIALGINSITGESNSPSEFLTFSRRYFRFNFTTGLAWGLVRSGLRMKNPLSIFGSHFSRDKSRGNRNRLETLFTGKDVGLFGGISYRATNNLTFKIDYSGVDLNNIHAGRKIDNPFSFSADYKVSDNHILSAGLENGERFMLRFNYNYDTKKIRDSSENKVRKVKEIRRSKKVNLSPSRLVLKARENDIKAYGASVYNSYADLWTEIGDKENPKNNFFDSLRVLYNNTSDNISRLAVVQSKNNIKGIKASILRKDLEAMDNHEGSLEKLIQKTEFSSTDGVTPQSAFANNLTSFFIKPIVDIDLFTDDIWARHRESIIIGAKHIFSNWQIGGAIRFNLEDNMEKEILYDNSRGTEYKYANDFARIENFYLRNTSKLFYDIYFDFHLGTLEEMYSGLAFEFLYKPEVSNWGIGYKEGLVKKRNPSAFFDIEKFYYQPINTYEFSLYYEPDCLENTVFALGYNRYLAGDHGLSFSAKREFNNGMKLKAYVNFSDFDDAIYQDLNSFRTNAGFKLKIPFGSRSNNNYAEVNIAPLGLVPGEKVHYPNNLYNDLRDVSYNRLIKFK